MRWVIALVLPLPGPASTSSGPSVVVTAWRWGGFSPVSRSLERVSPVVICYTSSLLSMWKRDGSGGQPGYCTTGMGFLTPGSDGETRTNAENEHRRGGEN